MDEFGNLCGEGGARFGVRASAHVRLHEVSDNEDGTYTVTYSIPDWAQGQIKLEARRLFQAAFTCAASRSCWMAMPSEGRP